MTFLLKKTIKQGTDKESKGRWESGMVNHLFLINGEANNFILRKLSFSLPVTILHCSFKCDGSETPL